MKFDKLFKIITEAKNEQPGNRFFNVQNSAGPASYVSGPIGKSDNFELPTFTDNLIKDIGSAMGSKWYNTMFTSFGLLNNDETFKTNFNKISEEFGKRRVSYNHTKNVTDYETGESEKIAYDYEKKLDNLEFMKSKRAGQVSKLIDERKHYLTRQNDWEKYSKSPLQKKRLSVEYAGSKAIVDEIEKQNKKEKNNYFYEIKQIYADIETTQNNVKKLEHNILLTKSESSRTQIQKDIDTLNMSISKLKSSLDSKKYAKELVEFRRYRSHVRTLNNIESKYINSQLDDTTVNREAKAILDLNAKITEMESSYQEIVNELEENYAYIDQINEVNQEADQKAQGEFIQEVGITAARLLREYKVDLTAANPNIDWSALPKSNMQKFNVLQALTSDDPNINPMIWYLNAFQNSYDNREYDSSRQMDSKTNITSIRDFERLPFSIIMKIYKGVYTKPINLQAKEYDESKSGSWDILSEYLLAFKGMRGDELFEPFVSRKFKSPDTLEMVPILSGLKVRDVWINVNNKDFIKKLINDLGLPESFKTKHILEISDPRRPMSSTRSGANSFIQLWSAIDSDIRGTTVKKESFDRVFERLIIEKGWDEDDFKINTMELLSLVNRSK